MSWARIDDSLYDHPKTDAVNNDALAVWVCALSYCSKHLTDGFLADSTAEQILSRRHATKQVLQQLLEAPLGYDFGFWEKVEGGYRVHDYLDFNPSRQEVLLGRKKRSEAGRKGGLKSGETRRVRAEMVTDRVGESKQMLKHMLEAKSNPGPARPGPTHNEDPGADALAELSTNVDNSAPADAVAAHAAVPLDFLSRYAQRLKEPGANRGAVLGAAVREKWAVSPEFRLLGKIAKTFGAMEILTIIDEAPESLDEDPHEFLVASANRRQARGRGPVENWDKPSPEIGTTPRSAASPAPNVPELTAEEQAAIEAERRERWKQQEHERKLQNDPAYRAKWERDRALHILREHPTKTR